MKTAIKNAFAGFLKTLAVAIITSLLIVGAIVAVSPILERAEVEREKELVALQEQTLNATLAEACELALPVDPEKGRDPELVKQCFTQYGIEAPRVLDANG